MSASHSVEWMASRRLEQSLALELSGGHSVLRKKVLDSLAEVEDMCQPEVRGSMPVSAAAPKLAEGLLHVGC